MENKLKRNTRIKLTGDEGKKFSVTDAKDDTPYLSSDDDYFIYMKAVNFRNDGTIDGRYLGEAHELLIDEHCSHMEYRDGAWHTMYTNFEMKTARMVAVNNKKDVTIVIHAD